MPDLLSNNSELFRQLDNEYSSFMKKENFEEIRTPILEEKSLFQRSAGESSDIVQKEMFETIDGYVLRPENTAPVVRSYIENYKKYSKYFYFGPQFRKERPQLGRLRQFYQYGFEIFGDSAPQSEIESLILVNNLYKLWGLSEFEINVNFLGSEIDRSNYILELEKFLLKNKEDLSEESKKRLSTNLLRILDSKNEQDKIILKNAPIITNYLTKESKKEFDKIIEIAESLNINLKLNPFLVRGLDYYTGFVFEVLDTSKKLGSQNALGGGGRYNNLIKELGGQNTPAFGFAGGVERLILSKEMTYAQNKIIKISILTSQKESLVKFLDFKTRNKNLYIDIFFNNEFSFKKVFKRADQLGFDFVLIEGDIEFSNNYYKIKNLKTGNESILKNLDDIISLLKD